MTVNLEQMTAAKAKSYKSRTCSSQDGLDGPRFRKAKAVLILHRNRRGRKGGATKGQTLLEFLLVAPIFLFLMFAVLDFGRLFFVQMDLEEAVQEAARYASTGNHLPDPNNPNQSLSRVQSIINEAEQAAIGWGASVTNVQVSSLGGGAGSAGGPGDIVTVSLTVSLNLMTPIVARGFPNGAYTFVSSSTVKNELFPASETN
jgi:Flp pilus assembly protein TadG